MATLLDEIRRRRAEAAGRAQRAAEQPNGDQPNGDQPNGDQPNGDRPNGDRPNGDRPNGDQPNGDQPNGDQPNGDRPNGDQPNGGKSWNGDPANVMQPTGMRLAPPAPPGATAGAPSRPRYDPEEEKHRRTLDILMLQQQHDRDKWKREDEFRWAQLEQQNRQAELRQRRPRKFTARMNGMGQASFKVVWDDGGRSRTVSSDGSSGPGGWNRPGAPRAAIGDRASYRGVDAKKAAKAKEARDADAMDWMPVDSLRGQDEDSRRDYVADDFTSDLKPHGTGRFQGGYLDPEFKRRYIESRMNGLVEGDAGYANRRAAIETMWGRQRAEYDRSFRLYGKNLLTEQERRKQVRQAARGGDTETIAAAAARQMREATKIAANMPVRKARRQ